MLETLGWVLTGGLVPFLLVFCGGFFLIYLRGQPMLCPGRMLKSMTSRQGSGGVSPFRAVTLALAGTLGVGNIVGVANALWIGGAGALFWMWVSALVAMILKYAEIVLAVRHRRQAAGGGFFGGAIYYIRDWLSSRRMAKLGAVLSAVFAVLMVLDALSMGCVIQVNAVTSAFEGVFGLPTWICGGVLMLLAIPVICRGAKGTSALTEYLIPIMSGGYILLSGAVLVFRSEAVGPAFASVFREAFRPSSAAGGVLGFLTSRALRVGTMRGLLSNEAGCGTAPTAHACADTNSPAAQGIWGIFEVFVDTILLCTATALVILVSFPDVEMFGDNAVMMTIRAYSSVLGKWSEYFFCAAVFCFGYATVICWANYGLESVRALSPGRGWRRAYLFLFSLCIPAGAMLAPGVVWTVSDFAIATLTTINLAVLLALRREVREETRRWRKGAS